MYQPTTATNKIFDLTKRIRAVCGGTSASKTISILIYLIDYAQACLDKKLITIVSQSYNHLAGGAMLDFQNIMQEHGYWNDTSWVKSPVPQYTFPNGTIIEFRSVDKIGKAKGMRRDILFLNEANHIDYQIAIQLILRTRDFIFADWNPTNEFWFYTEMLGKREDVDFITLTYKDNEALDENTIKEIEALKDNKRLWEVYGLGLLGELEGRIYTGWKKLKEIPHEARLIRYGVDFGYSIDPTAITAIYYYNGGYIVDLLCYKKEMSGKEIADTLKASISNYGSALTKADSADPRLIDELKMLGINIQPCVKGADSVRKGIETVQSLKISYTARSHELEKEYKNYFWKQDKDGNFISPNIPDSRLQDHALDSLRYAIEDIQPPRTVNIKPQVIKKGSIGKFGRRVPARKKRLF